MFRRHAVCRRDVAAHRTLAAAPTLPRARPFWLRSRIRGVSRKKRATPAAPASPGPMRGRRPGRGFLAVALAVAAMIAAGLWWRVAHRIRRLNLLLVTIDTVRADHVGVYGAA